MPRTPPSSSSITSAPVTRSIPHWGHAGTPLGPMVLAATTAGLCGAWFAGQKHFGGPSPDWIHDEDHPLLVSARAQLDDWFDGRRHDFDLPLAPRGTPFQQAVWQTIRQVGHGRTLGYGAAAAQVGRPSASRAVGAATGRNPLSLLVPCHRLVAASGALTGYAGGLARKAWLLDFEQGIRRPFDAASVEAAS